MSATTKPIKYRDGWSEQVWKSLAIKALRLAWPTGLEEAAKRLPPSMMKGVLLTNLFEDVFMPASELPDCWREVQEQDYVSLCLRTPHQGREWTPAFCALEKESVAAARNPEEVRKMREVAYSLGLPFLPPRSLNTFYTWAKIEPDDPGQTRDLDVTEWTGEMPMMCLDVHSPEGRAMGRRDPLMSGYYHTLLEQSVIVHEFGWDELRSRAWAEGFASPQFELWHVEREDTR